jgi:deoxyribodipyrimidine photo-lyase
MSDRPVLVWYRHDLRVDDHPALTHAASTGAPVAALYVMDDALDGRALGAASRWWLHHSLDRLQRKLREMGVPLLIRQGSSADLVPAMATRIGARLVAWNKGSTPFARAVEEDIHARLARDATDMFVGAADLIAEPGAVRSQSNKPFQVFTPFWRTLAVRHPPASPCSPPARVRGYVDEVETDTLDALGLLPARPDWSGGLQETWEPGETAAIERLEDFLSGPIEQYASERNAPSRPGTSMFSPYLRFGEISVRRLWHAATALAGPLAEPFLRQLGWREFNRHILFRRPDLASRPIRREFDAFPFRDDVTAFDLWSRGRTGFPIVDAGMRELWHTGWMHNRVRMITASFLVKDLLLPWQWGERWFWDTLVDADPANNPASWQWVAGCGTDAAPFFRIFNPVLQGKKFDPRGNYVRRWLPELADVPDASIHRAGQSSGGLFGNTYPPPMVDHGAARRRALEVYKSL